MPRRGRRLRRQGRRAARGAAPRRAGPPGRPPGALGRDPHREHDSPWATAGARSSTSRIGGTRDGRITAYQLDVSRTPAPTRMHRRRPALHDPDDDDRRLRHHQRRLRRRPRSSPTPRRCAAFRGAGRPEAAAAIERAVDLFAAEIGMDPAEVRRRNLLAADRLPVHDPASGTHYDSGRLRRRPLDLVLEAAGYDDLRAEQAAAAGGGRHAPARHRPRRLRRDHRRRRRREYGSVELLDDGTVVVRTGSTPYGQGHDTTWAMLVSDQLGIPMERIEVIHGDTDVVPVGRHHRRVPLGPDRRRRRWPTRPPASWSTQARQRAADLLEADVDDVVLDTDGGPLPRRRHARPSASAGPRSAARPDDPLIGVVATSPPTARPSPSAPTSRWSRSTPRPATVALRAPSSPCDDAGTHPQPAAGRRPGPRRARPGRRPGPVRGDPLRRRRQPADDQLRRLPVISAAELPSFERVEMETPTPLNELGAKGIGESGTHRLHPGRAERGDRRAGPPRRAPHRHALHPRAGLAGHPGRRLNDTDNDNRGNHEPWPVSRGGGGRSRSRRRRRPH